MPRPIYCKVFPKSIAHNLQTLKSRAPSSKFYAVVKANAYGHGIERIFSGLEKADGLALLEIEQAKMLRDLGWEKPILLLEGCFEGSDLEQALSIKCDLVIHESSQLKLLARHNKAIKSSNFKPQLYIKINTGMNRLGFNLNVAQSVIDQVNTLVGQLDLPKPVVMTHYANADVLEDHSVLSVKAQHSHIQNLNYGDWQTSLGNSAACLNWPQFAGDIVRPGVALYGATPGPRAAFQYDLIPAMGLYSAILSLQPVSRGQAVGYGSRYIASENKLIAIVACGYADGYPRHAPDGTPVWVSGKLCKLVGRVSMDLLAIDVTSISEVEVGDKVELWGENLPVDMVATACGTIGYQLLCAVSSRVQFRVSSS